MNYNEIIKEAQDIMQNLFEVEYYGANDVEEEKNKIKKQKKDKNGDIVDVVSVEDELFPYEGNAKQQYNQKIISKINDMIEGRATLEDLIQLVRKKRTSVSESEFTAHKGNPVVKITDKNYKVAHGKGLPGPFNEKQIGQYIVYNKDTDASYLVTPDNWKKSKIKRDLEREGKVFEGAIELLEALLQDTKAIRRNKELNAKRAEKKAKELKKQRNELDRKEQIAFGDAATLKNLADYHTDTNGREAEETKNVRSNAADAIKKHRNVLKELKKVANDYSNATLDAIHNKYQARRAQDKVNMLTDR